MFLLIETCDPLAFVMVLANGNQVLNDNAGLCTDGTHSAPEAVVMQTCKAPAPSAWTAGPKVNRRELPFECTFEFTSRHNPGVYMYILYLLEGGMGVDKNVGLDHTEVCTVQWCLLTERDDTEACQEKRGLMT